MLHLFREEFQPGETKQDASWRIDQQMAGILLWGTEGQDPSPAMNLVGFGVFPVSCLARAWHHCSP